MNRVTKLAAFTSDPRTGNPAGVWIGDSFPSDAEMQRIAADVGFSETAFVIPQAGLQRTVRYFSPETEVDFCGHATIASAVHLGELTGPGVYDFTTNAGVVPVLVERMGDYTRAALTSVPPRHERVEREVVRELLDLLRWPESGIDAAIPPARIFAGMWHFLIAVKDRSILAALDYDFERTKSWMQRHGLTTLQLVHRESEALFHSRNPFPVGGVYEDAATGAAAAALGGYLRDRGLIDVPSTFVVRQGEDMGRLSILEVEVPATGGIVVAGTAVKLLADGAIGR